MAAALTAAAVAPAWPGAAAAQENGAIRGQVVTTEALPAAGVDVRIVSLGRLAETGEEGRFHFSDVPAGSHLLEAVTPRGLRGVESATVTGGGTTEVTITLTRLYHGDEIVVTAGPSPARSSDLFQPADVLTRRDLASRAEASLGETLRDRPGVNASFFGPGSSRPVIRGLGGDRVRVLQSGVGTGDASNTSPDHAVGLEPVSAERIEIIRGPATLLYGSSAVGGVVNVVDRRIPRELPARPVTGTVEGVGGTVADELTGSASLDGAVGRFAWHASALRRDAGDYGIPGSAERVPNSFVETTRGAAGLSYVGESGFLGVSWSAHDSEYGVPGHGHEDSEHEEGEHDHGEEEEPGEEDAAIDLRQRRVDVEGAWRTAAGPLRGLKARVGVTDYRHFELEGDEIGTRFDNDEWELRLEARNELGDVARGAAGFQFTNRDFSALGEEAFVPPTDSERWAVFLYEELGEGPLRYQVGGRFERQRARVEPTGLEATHEGFSVSAGLNWAASDRVTLAFTGARSVKLPTTEELFSDGPHLATRAFEVGDPGLEEEVAWSADASIRLREGPVTGEANFFVNRFQDFVFPGFTGEEEDGLPVLLYRQADALFLGYEAQAQLHLYERGDHHLLWEVSSDYVRAELTADDRPLPRIPPLRFGGGLRYEGGPWEARVGARRVTGQDRVGLFETPTDGYTMLNATAGYSFRVRGLTHQILLRGRNLTDEEARSHTSFLKDVAPLPGREVRLTYRLSF